jgi:hypothetical protein
MLHRFTVSHFHRFTILAESCLRMSDRFSVRSMPTFNECLKKRNIQVEHVRCALLSESCLRMSDRFSVRMQYADF